MPCRGCVSALCSSELWSVASEHEPFSVEQKEAGVAKDFTHVPPGVPGVEHRFPLLWQLAVVRPMPMPMLMLYSIYSASSLYRTQSALSTAFCSTCTSTVLSLYNYNANQIQYIRIRIFRLEPEAYISCVRSPELRCAEGAKFPFDL